MSTKIAGVSLYIWGFGALVAAALIWTVQALPKTVPDKSSEASAAIKAPSPLPTKTSQEPEEDANKAAGEYLRTIQKVITTRYDKEKAESDLSAQVTAGRAQLKAMEFSDAKSAYEAAASRSDAAGANLQRIERKGSGDLYYSPLRGFRSYGELVVNSHFSKIDYKGITHPETRQLFDEYLRVAYKITLEEIMSGNYKVIEFPTYSP